MNNCTSFDPSKKYFPKKMSHPDVLCMGACNQAHRGIYKIHDKSINAVPRHNQSIVSVIKTQLVHKQLSKESIHSTLRQRFLWRNAERGIKERDVNYTQGDFWHYIYL